VVDFVSFVIIELFVVCPISYGVGVISGNMSKSAFFEGVGQHYFERKF